MRFFLTSFVFACLLLVLCQQGYGQEVRDENRIVPCAVSISELPPVRSIRLGMSKAEFQALFRRKRAGRPGREVFRDIASFQQAHAIDVNFQQDTLTGFAVTYDNRLVSYRDLQSFTRNLSDSLGISNRSWEFADGRGRVVCNDFEVETAMLPIGPKVAIARLDHKAGPE